MVDQWRRERADLDPASMALFARLTRAHLAASRAIDATLRRHGLKRGEFDVLATLRRAGAPYERAPVELAATTMVTTGAMTKRIDRLEARGLVTRRPSAEDGRMRVVGLTEAGRALIDEAFTAHMANERRLLDALSPEDARTMERLLTAWLGTFERPDS